MIHPANHMVTARLVKSSRPVDREPATDEIGGTVIDIHR
jgi:hypothetical protein